MVMPIISWVIVGAIGGWLAGYILTKNTAFNMMDVILGMVGALVGGWLSTTFLNADPAGISVLSIVSALVGALIVAFIYEKVTGKSAQ